MTVKRIDMALVIPLFYARNISLRYQSGQNSYSILNYFFINISVDQDF